MNKTKIAVKYVTRLSLALAGTGLMAGLSASASSITEPPTTFYGKVVGMGGEQPFLINEGDLQWTIQRADGSELQLETELFPLNNGNYSYRLEIPHTADSIGLDESFGIPMPSVGSTNEHAVVRVNGALATFAGPSGAYFEVGQNSRAATYRLDLTVDVAPRDSDGDGMPDWWEDAHNLNKQSLADAALDSDGDGLTNAEEYAAGLDPFQDNREPGLLTEELLAYSDGMTGFRLMSSDIDSDAAVIEYTLVEAPAFGRLVLRNATETPDAADLTLEAGGQFTQQQVMQGQLIFIQEGELPANAATAMRLSINDENAVHAPVEATVAIQFFVPPQGDILLSETDQQRQRAFLAGLMDEVVVWDALNTLMPVYLAAPSAAMTVEEYAAYQLLYGADLPQYMLGGRGDDVLFGGMGDDLLIGGAGNDELNGGGGADVFVFNASDLDDSIITDFSVAEGDILNLDAVLKSAEGQVDQFVRFEADGADTLVRVGKAGDGSFDDLTVTLAGVQLNAMDAYDWVDQGSVRVANLRLLPSVSVVATDAAASENGGNSGVYTFSRRGDWSQPLTVDYLLGGSAVNGTDFSLLGSSITFAAGQKQVELLIQPFADNAIEPDEVVELILVEQAAYRMDGATTAQVTIKDLQAVIGIEVLEALATTSPVGPGLVLVSRSGQTANSLFVRLSIGGKAANGSDYQYISSYVSFAAGQTVVPLEIVPMAGAVLDGGAEVVDISVNTDSSYALADQSRGRITLVASRDSLEQWKQREFPESELSLNEFALSDGAGGSDHLLMYAYGVDSEQPDTPRLPQIVWREGHMTVDVFRNPAATDVQVLVDVSSDLISWDASDVKVQKIETAEHALAADVETYQAVPLVETDDQLFMRVRVEYLK